MANEDKFELKSVDWKVPIERSLLIDERINNSSLRLYLILLSYARDKVTAFPSRETLAGDMGCKVRNIDFLKNKLRTLGLLDWISKYNGSNKYNIYSLLQYQPIKKGNKGSKQKPEPKATGENFIIKENKTKLDSSMQEVVDIFTESYGEFCNNCDEDTRYLIQSPWVNNPMYIPSQGDVRNLKWYKDNYGEDGLKKLSISFKFLGEYIKDSIDYGNFHTSRGSELVPTISLFVKAKFQHDNIMQYALDELRRKSS